MRTDNTMHMNDNHSPEDIRGIIEREIGSVYTGIQRMVGLYKLVVEKIGVRVECS
jgi:hypothetical protein